MNCNQSRNAIALKAGCDLDPVAQRELKQHLHECPHCRQHHREMLSSMKALQFAESQTDMIESESLWPEVSLRIRARRPGARPQRFNGWIPAAGVLAACLLIAVVSNQNPSVSPLNDETAYNTAPVNMIPVLHSTVPVSPSALWNPEAPPKSRGGNGAIWSPQRLGERPADENRQPEDPENPSSEVHFR